MNRTTPRSSAAVARVKKLEAGPDRTDSTVPWQRDGARRRDGWGGSSDGGRRGGHGRGASALADRESDSGSDAAASHAGAGLGRDHDRGRGARDRRGRAHAGVHPHGLARERGGPRRGAVRREHAADGGRVRDRARDRARRQLRVPPGVSGSGAVHPAIDVGARRDVGDQRVHRGAVLRHVHDRADHDRDGAALHRAQRPPGAASGVGGRGRLPRRHRPRARDGPRLGSGGVRLRPAALDGGLRDRRALRAGRVRPRVLHGQDAAAGVAGVDHPAPARHPRGLAARGAPRRAAGGPGAGAAGGGTWRGRSRRGRGGSPTRCSAGSRSGP